MLPFHYSEYFFETYWKTVSAGDLPDYDTAISGRWR